jgi:hypothetical protein
VGNWYEDELRWRAQRAAARCKGDSDIRIVVDTINMGKTIEQSLTEYISNANPDLLATIVPRIRQLQLGQYHAYWDGSHRMMITRVS